MTQLWNWKPRTEPTPDGVKIWVSDGEEIWMLTGDGKVFPDRARLCKFWVPAILPTLPSGAATDRIED